MEQHPADVVGATFQAASVPNNIRLARWLGNMRPARWMRSFHDWMEESAVRLPILDALGHVTYQRGAQCRLIPFDGRNQQFSAVYDDRYRYGYELETAMLVVHLARSNGAFYDVGSNWGYFCLIAAAVPDFRGAIFAFEPNPRSYADLFRTIEAAGLTSRVHTFGCGLGSADGTLRLEETDGFRTGLTQLKPEGSGPPIDVRTLDTLGLAPAQLIKIDAEGMELEVLRGGVRSIEQHQPHLIFESFVNYQRPARTSEPIEFLNHLGYRLFNPLLRFNLTGQVVLSSYGEPVGPLLARDPRPTIHLEEISPLTRYMMHPHLNVFACHRSRIAEVVDEKFVHLGKPLA